MIATVQLEGPWKNGAAFDIHSSGRFISRMDQYGEKWWETKRTEMGQLVDNLKYGSDLSAVTRIVNLLGKLPAWAKGVDFIVPVPPSSPRSVQAVLEVAKELGTRHGIPVLADLLTMKPNGREQKDVVEPAERRRLLRESLVLTGSRDVTGKSILLVDDIFRSGATLEAATKILYDVGRATNVAVLTMTKTRVSR